MKTSKQKSVGLELGDMPKAEAGRRAVLRSGLLFGLSCGLGLLDSLPAWAAKEFAGRTITLASWGGAYQDAQIKAYCDPFAIETGAAVLQEEPMNFAKLRTMVERGHPVWDVVDVTRQFLVDAEELFDSINENIVHVSRTRPDYHNKYGVADCVWSTNIAYSASAFPSDNGPSSWTEVFDVNRFPGTRTLEDRVSPTLEIALMADGVAPDKLYPLDVDRAFRRLDAIRKHTIFWASDAQAEELFTDGDVTCGMLPNGRAYDAVQKGAKVTLVWNQNAQTVDYLAVPKGSPNADVAMHLIDMMTIAKNQARFSNLIPYSPTNPDAFEWIDKKMLPWLPTAEGNARKGFLISAPYWRNNYQKLAERWENWKLS